jgi:hypothetical protein
MDLDRLLVRKGRWITGNQLIRRIEMFDGTGLFIDHFEDATIESVNDGITDQHLDIAADGVTDGIRPSPGGSYYTIWRVVLLFDGVELRCVDIGEINDEGGTRNEFALDGQRTDSGAAKISEIVELYAAPLRGPTGAPSHDGFIELYGWFALRCIQSFPVLKTGGDDL